MPLTHYQPLPSWVHQIPSWPPNFLKFKIALFKHEQIEAATNQAINHSSTRYFLVIFIFFLNLFIYIPSPGNMQHLFSQNWVFQCRAGVIESPWEGLCQAVDLCCCWWQNKINSQPHRCSHIFIFVPLISNCRRVAIWCSNFCSNRHIHCTLGNSRAACMCPDFPPECCTHFLCL